MQIHCDGGDGRCVPFGNVSAQPARRQKRREAGQIAVSVLIREALMKIARRTSQDLVQVLVELEPVGQQAKKEQEHREPEEHEP